MRLGRLQVNWNKPLPKMDRKLDLIHFYTFKGGENIYTYKVEDLAKISGRYLDEVKNTLNFMLQYSAGPKQVEAFANNIEHKLLEAIEEPIPKKRIDLVIEAREISKRLPKLQDYVSDLELKKWYDLYTMFFVLEGEDECLFSKKWNAKKIELLEAEDEEVRELFFCQVDAFIQYCSTIYREDILASMIKERDMANLAESLTLLTKPLNTKSKLQDGQELASTNTET